MRGSISSRFSSNSEAKASEILENLEEMSLFVLVIIYLGQNNCTEVITIIFPCLKG